MEQKKILWIVLLMAAFITIIFGAAFYLYSPSKTHSVASGDTIDLDSLQNPIDNTAVDPDMWAREPEKIPAYSDDEKRALNTTNITTNITFVNGNEASSDEKGSEDGSFDVSGLVDSKKTAEKELPPEIAEQIGVEVSGKQDNSAKGKEKTPAKKAVSENIASGVSERKGSLAPKKTQTSKVSAPAKSEKETKSSASKTPQVKNTAASKPKVSVEIIYWVQTASLSSRLNAEKVRDKLLERHMKVEIFTKETSSGLTHRVRVGPFKNNTEAEYWLKNIKEIKGFEGSYISQERIKL